MNADEFHNMLVEKEGSVLHADSGLRRYQHVERLGSDDTRGLLDGEVVIQEKLDGANLTVAWTEKSGLIVCSRANVIHTDETGTTNEFRGAVKYVKSDARIGEFFRNNPNKILRGEWLVRHSINYPADVMSRFYVFDIQDAANGFAYVDSLHLCNVHLLQHVPEVARGKFDAREIIDLSLGKSLLAPDVNREGVVVKRYDFRNQYGRVVWGKVVNAEFKQKNKLHFRPTRHDEVEMHFAAGVTEALVLKTIEKIRTETGSVNITDMTQILGRVWHDMFKEELWDFVKKNKVKNFDFATAQKLVYLKTRDLALAYFNGIL